MKKCLVVVDYQNDFVIGSLGFEEAKKLDTRIYDKILKYRKAGGTVIFTFDTHKSDYPLTQEGRKLPVAHCIEGTSGHMLYGKTGTLFSENDISFYKSAFGSHELYEYLRKQQFDKIELAGVVSNICVISNAVLAKTACPEALITVDALCVASFDKAQNESALDVMESLQMEIINRKL